MKPPNSESLHAVRLAAEQMGRDLRSARLARSWILEIAAARVGVSLATYKRMEAGDTAVALGSWLRAWEAIGLLPALADATSPRRDVAGERMRRFQRVARRRRVSRHENEWDY